jgi:very-short-patch-repair endonuclease
MPAEPEPFIGSEALGDGALNRHQLRTRYLAQLPGIYLPKHTPASLEQRTVGAWLWSGRQAIVAGSAAAALHRTKWIDDDTPVELIHANPRAPRGVITRRDTVLDDEVQTLALPAGKIRVTTPIRTAFDIGRRGPVRTAIARLDALARATDLQVDDVGLIARQHPHTRGLRRLEQALDLVDAGAESPRETYLRLLLIEAGFPRPQTQIQVTTDHDTYYLDMGWEDQMLAVEYDGDQHRTDRARYAYEIRRAETLAALGWLVIRVVADHRSVEVVHRVRRAWGFRRLSVP